MSLTHERVRALRDLLTAEGAVVGNANAVARALCDEWLAVRTVRWVGQSLRRRDWVCDISERHMLGDVVAEAQPPTGSFKSGGEWYAVVAPQAVYPNAKLCATEAEARAWCEEQARAAGLEVAT